ncbi:MAG: hypothetical protein L6425_11620, partial [Candidatus Aminicenantes bacterium]|nr:hypothetical protein [Candidatus Aminicenantes bacterium]
MFDFLPRQNIGKSFFFLRFEKLEGLPFRFVKDFPIEKSESTDGLFEKGLGIMFYIFHLQKILAQFFFNDLIGRLFIKSFQFLQMLFVDLDSPGRF